MRILGIDPGKSGGWALVDVPPEALILRHVLPDVIGAGPLDLASLDKLPDAELVAVEEQQVRRSKFIKNIRAETSLNQDYGFIVGHFAARGITVVPVRPIGWQRAAGLVGTKRKLKAKLYKELLLQRVRQLVEVPEAFALPSGGVFLGRCWGIQDGPLTAALIAYSQIEF